VEGDGCIFFEGADKLNGEDLPALFGFDLPVANLLSFQFRKGLFWGKQKVQLSRTALKDFKAELSRARRAD